MGSISDIRDAILAQADGDELAAIELPETFRASVTLRSDIERIQAIPFADRDPRDALHVRDIPVPELAPDECLIAVMASCINYNTVWSSTFHPIPTFDFLDRFARTGKWAARHQQDFHILGSDAAGVVLRCGSAVRAYRPGDRVVVHPTYVTGEDPAGHEDGMLSTSQLAWGFETNYGGLAEMAVAKANQLLPKAAHLTWEEAAATTACNATAYRMLISHNGAQMRLGDSVLLWGATGGIGAYGIQLTRAAGGTPLGIVSRPERAALLRELGVERVIDRTERDYRFWSDEHTQDESEWRRFGSDVRDLLGNDPEIVFEHPGRETMGASVFACRRGGTVVTCAATTGYMLEFDNRHLWMKLKRIVSTHTANYAEFALANRLVTQGTIYPALSATYDLHGVGEAARAVQQNTHDGKLGVLCLSPGEGLGIEDPARRATIGEARTSTFARALTTVTGVQHPRILTGQTEPSEVDVSETSDAILASTSIDLRSTTSSRATSRR